MAVYRGTVVKWDHIYYTPQTRNCSDRVQWPWRCCLQLWRGRWGEEPSTCLTPWCSPPSGSWTITSWSQAPSSTWSSWLCTGKACTTTTRTTGPGLSTWPSNYWPILTQHEEALLHHQNIVIYYIYMTHSKIIETFESHQ